MKRKLPDFLATQKWIRRRAEVWVCNIRLDILAQSALMVEGCLFYLMGETKLCIIDSQRSRYFLVKFFDKQGLNIFFVESMSLINTQWEAFISAACCSI